LGDVFGRDFAGTGFSSLSAFFAVDATGWTAFFAAAFFGADFASLDLADFRAEMDLFEGIIFLG